MTTRDKSFSVKELAMIDDPRTVLGYLRAYGEQEATTALQAKDRDQYQFWQGWNAALQRVAALDDPRTVKKQLGLIALVETWRAESAAHYTYADELDAQHDGANSHAERKAGRICREHADLLAALGDPPGHQKNDEKIQEKATRVDDSQYDPPPTEAEPLATAASNSLVPNCGREATVADANVVHAFQWISNHTNGAGRWFCTRCGYLGPMVQ